LRHRATLQREALSPDGGGGHTSTWSDVATVWAEVAPRAGDEAFAAGRIEARTRLRLRLRFRDGVAAGMRIVLDGRILNVRAVLDDGRRRWLELDCEEGVAT
jgi:SPP1 family predicted phage head-tail adaptor